MKATRCLAAVAALLAATALTAPAWAEIKIRASTAAPDVAPLSEALRQIEKRMEEAYPGEIDFSVHAASALFRQGTELPAMQRGNLEMATPVTFEIEQQLPEYGILSAGYLFRSPEHMLKVFNGPIGEEFAAKVAEEMDIVILGTGYLGTRELGLREVREVESPEDLQGVKLRMPPGPAFLTLAKAMGVTPVSMPITEVYLALQTGAIDGQDNPTSMTRDWKFNEVTKEIVMTNHLIQPVFVAIAKPVFEKLTPEQQETLKAATKEVLAVQVQETLEDEKEALTEFEKAGIVIDHPNLELFRANAAKLYAEEGYAAEWQPGLREKIEATE